MKRLLALLITVIALAVPAAGGEQDMLNWLVDRMMEKPRNPPVGKIPRHPPIPLPDFRLGFAQPVEAEERWREEADPIRANIERLMRLDSSKSPKFPYEDDDLIVIYDYLDYEGLPPWSRFSGFRRYRHGVGPWLSDGHDRHWYIPGGTGFYSAPEPWVIHTKRPFIGTYSPSPYYNDPPMPYGWVDDDGLYHPAAGGPGWWRHYSPIYTWRPSSSTSWSLNYDSDAGSSFALNLFRPWGRVSFDDGPPPTSNNTGRHGTRFSLSFNSSNRSSYLVPGLGIVYPEPSADGKYYYGVNPSVFSYNVWNPNFWPGCGYNHWAWGNYLYPSTGMPLDDNGDTVTITRGPGFGAIPFALELPEGALPVPPVPVHEVVVTTREATGDNEINRVEPPYRPFVPRQPTWTWTPGKADPDQVKEDTATYTVTRHGSSRRTVRTLPSGQQTHVFLRDRDSGDKAILVVPKGMHLPTPPSPPYHGKHTFYQKKDK